MVGRSISTGHASLHAPHKDDACASWPNSCNPARAGERVGVIPFNLEGYSQFLVAAILGYEGGIGVRSGCFCAHPYVVHLLGLSADESAIWQAQILGGDKSNMPGMVRISFGCYSNTDDIDRLVIMLERISRGDYQGRYQQVRSSGEYLPEGYTDLLEDYFLLEEAAHSIG